MKKAQKYFLSLAVILVILVNILAWKSTAFCDYYAEQIFPIWLNSYGRWISCFPFSVGEVMIVLAVILLSVFVISGFAAVIFLSVKKWKEKKKVMMDSFQKIYTGFFHYFHIYSMVCAHIFVAVLWIMTLNCFILYHTSSFEEKYWNGMVKQTEDYTVEELAELRDFVVMRVNQYAKMMERDEHGLILYDGNMEETAIMAMQNLGKQYPQLAGYYTMPKKIAASEFLSQQYMKGYYFPFSLEANYNDVMYIMSKPAAICHELAHTKGFIYEDEANLIAFLACLYSDDPFFQYSGYLSVLTYIDNDFIKSIDHNAAVYQAHVKVSPQVKKDRVFLTEDAWTEVEKKAVVSTKVVKKASHAFNNTTLILNGVEKGSASYGEVVGLLMDYYMCMDDSRLENEYMAATEKEFLSE